MFAERLALCLLPSDVISDEFEKLEEAATDADDPVRDHLHLGAEVSGNLL